MKTLNIQVDDINLSTALDRVINAVNNKKAYRVVTPNPEITTQAQSDPVLATILNNANLAIPDGVGLRLAGIRNTTPGVELMRELIKLAAINNWGIGLYGGRGNSAKLALAKLQAQHPNLKGWAMAAPELKIGEKFDDEYKKIISKIKLNNTKIVFIALGAPKQEYFMDKLKTDTVLMVVGGGFDEIAGLVRPTPAVVNKLGLKWLWRLIWQPWRITRQLRLIKFLYLYYFKTGF